MEEDVIPVHSLRKIGNLELGVFMEGGGLITATNIPRGQEGTGVQCGPLYSKWEATVGRKWRRWRLGRILTKPSEHRDDFWALAYGRLQ